MDPRTLNFFAQATAGDLIGGRPHSPVLRVCTDSRAVRAGDLFVALKGDNFDGHDFVPATIKQGAVGVVVRRDYPGEGIDPTVGVIRVEDPRRALGQMAARYRQDFELPVIAVAGSNGKTSTKDLLASVLGRRFSVLASEASFNNDIGVPLTLLRFEAGHQ